VTDRTNPERACGVTRDEGPHSEIARPIRRPRAPPGRRGSRQASASERARLPVAAGATRSPVRSGHHRVCRSCRDYTRGRFLPSAGSPDWRDGTHSWPAARCFARWDHLSRRDHLMWSRRDGTLTFDIRGDRKSGPTAPEPTAPEFVFVRCDQAGFAAAGRPSASSESPLIKSRCACARCAGWSHATTNRAYVRAGSARWAIRASSSALRRGRISS
jgi:hypothetical protein